LDTVIRFKDSFGDEAWQFYGAFYSVSHVEFRLTTEKDVYRK